MELTFKKENARKEIDYINEYLYQYIYKQDEIKRKEDGNFPIKIISGSNTSIGHYIIEFKKWIFIWRITLSHKEQKIIHREFIINSKLFWFEKSGTFRRFRWK